MEPWRTAIVEAAENSIRVHGYDVAALMQRATFTDHIFLLHRGRLPNGGERALLDAILVGVADHGSGAPSCATARLAASGNRQSLSAAVAAGVLAIGDEHGGAGETCMVLIGRIVEDARNGASSIQDVALDAVAQTLESGQRVPGFGHRTHSRDPRTDVLFALARQGGIAGDGVACLEALDAGLRRHEKALPINIDGALAAVLFDLGFPPAFGKLIFIIGRVAGLTAEVYEEHSREKPMRIKIPVAYDGEAARKLD